MSLEGNSNIVKASQMTKTVVVLIALAIAAATAGVGYANQHHPRVVTGQSSK
jgi:hypothetical protein